MQKARKAAISGGVRPVMPDESARRDALQASTEALMQAAEGYDAHHGALLDWDEARLLESGTKQPEAA